MPIYRRNTTWWYSITIDNKTYRGSCQTTDERSAREYHDRERAKLWRVKIVGDKPRRTWDETLNRWIAEHQHKRTIKGDERIAHWWTGEFAKRKVVYLDEITPDVVAEIRNAEVGRKKVRGSGGVSKATVNRKIALLRSVINAAHREYLWLEVCPLFRQFPENNNRVRYISPAEINRLLKALPEPYASITRFAFATGLRMGNVSGLRWSNINLQNRTATFPDLVMKNGLPFTAPLNQVAIDTILGWTGKHPEWVFVRPDGCRVNRMQSKLWKSALEKAGIENFRFHDTRHTWASMLRQSGKVGLDQIQELGGWKQSAMVQRYAHLSVEHLSQSASVLDDVLAPTAQILHKVA